MPKTECIRGIPRATELPKQDERPKRALSSVLYLNIKFPTWKPIKKTNITEPKNDTNKNNKSFFWNYICQK